MLASFALLGLLVVFSSFGYPWVYAGSFSDGVSYLYAADFFGTFSAIDALDASRHHQVAPGYPAFLALMGASSTSLGNAVLSQVLIVAVATILLVRYFEKLTASWAAALLLSTISLCMPWSLPWAFELTPEALLVALLALTFTLARSGIKPTRLVWLMAFLVGFLCLVRPECAPAIGALAIWAVGRGLGWRRVLAATAIASAPVLAWLLYAASGDIPSCIDDCRAFGLFSPNQYGFWTFVESEVRGLESILALTMPATRRSIAAGICVLVLAVPSILLLARQREFDGAFLALYLPTTVLYSETGDRVLFVGTTLPFLAGMACLTFTAALRHWRTWSRDSAPATLAALTIVWASAVLSPVWLQSLKRIATGPRDATLTTHTRSFAWFASRWPEAHLQVERELIEIARASRATVPDDECIYGTIPWMMSLHSQRRVLETPVPVSDSSGNFTATECRWFLISTFGGPQDSFLPLYPSGFDGGALQPVLTKDDDVFAALLMRR